MRKLILFLLIAPAFGQIAISGGVTVSGGIAISSSNTQTLVVNTISL